MDRLALFRGDPNLSNQFSVVDELVDCVTIESEQGLLFRKSLKPMVAPVTYLGSAEAQAVQHAQVLLAFLTRDDQSRPEYTEALFNNLCAIENLNMCSRFCSVVCSRQQRET